MKEPCSSVLAASAIALTALTGCARVSTNDARVQLEPLGPVIEPGQTASPEIYRAPRPRGEGPDGGRLAQGWAMLGREDRAAAAGSDEYAPSECAAAPGSPKGWDAVIDAIAARAANHRIVIINESHNLTRHRETTRRLLAKLRPLGFSVLAAEAFFHGPEESSPVEQQPVVAWPRLRDGGYVREPAFGRMVREAKSLHYRLAAYEEVPDFSQPEPTDPAELIARRETEQARNLAEILRRMSPDARLIVHVGYGHGAETPSSLYGQEIELMGARLHALTGIDALTISQTVCRQADGPAILAQPPPDVDPEKFDMIVAHPVERFVDHRPFWRREAGDIPIDIPATLQPSNEPLVIEAFAWGEPFEAVPVDRVFVEPGEELPLLLPPGRYRVRAVRMAD